MKRLLIWISIVAATLVVADVLLGIVFRKYMDTVGLKGDYQTSEHLVRDFDEDLVVLGSSVALNSINTAAIEDSTGLTTINGASNGQTFPFYLTMLKAIMARHTPKHVVLGFIPSNLTDTGLGPRYNFLAPYYGRGIADIDSCFDSRNATEKLFLKSNFYRLNTIWFRILLYNFVTPGIAGENGFVAKPLPPQPTPRLEPSSAEDQTISPERRRQLIEFVDLCKSRGVPLTIVFTPRCLNFPPDYSGSPVAENLREICDSIGSDVRFFDDTTLAPFDTDSSLFYDLNHINILGSKIYTDTIISRL